MLNVTFVSGLPAGSVAGENVAVAPVGRPVTVKFSGFGKVFPDPGLTVNPKVAVPPGATVALPELEPEATLIIKPVTTVTLVVVEAGA